MLIRLTCIGLIAIAATAQADPLSKAEYFEQHIRPVLIKHCYECHAENSAELGGSLLLDSADGWRTGGDSGPAIVPSNAAESLLISALEFESVEMPPSGRLPDEVIDHFRHWIDQGAFDPREGTGTHPASKGIDLDAGRDFWSFQNPQEVSPPTVPGSDWAWSDIDCFIESRRLQAELPYPGDADPIVSLRRLTFDLTGLPPSPELIQQFSDNPSPEHWRRIVDRQLASFGFAEHWGRHWLDVARYADSNGADFNATFHDAWRYRQFVVDAMATDKPFDEFVRQQIAGDLMPSDSDADRIENLVATGFLMLGSKMLSERDKAKLKMDIVDDQIDTVGRAFLGMTLGCARCHDHKFDPIPTKDYYALAGIFSSTKVLDGESQRYVSTWVKRDLPTRSEHRAAVEQHAAAKKVLTTKLTATKKQLASLRKAAPRNWGGTVVDDTEAKRTGHWKESLLTQPFYGAGYIHDDNKNKGETSVAFSTNLAAGRYEVRIAYTGSGSRAANVPIEIHTASGIQQATLNQSKPGSIAGLWESIGEYDFAADRPATVIMRNTGTQGYVIADAVQFLKPGEEAQQPADNKKHQQMIAAVSAEIKSLEAAIRDHDKTAPPPLPRAMAVVDEKQVEDACLCIRGEPHNKGPVVPRGFLQVVSSGSSIAIPEDQSGRLQLADWITDPDNPLTARVIVNRVWMHLIGQGLVRTVDNFGQLGDRPSHPELLDTLAIQFVREGWSIKTLVRKIVLSRVYRQSSNYHRVAFQADPDNRLLWRGHRKRLPAEALRDTMLVAAERLDRVPTIQPMQKFGVLVNNNTASSGAATLAESNRRSMYLQIIRGQLPPMLATFDFADPDILVGRRPATNVPSQALVMLNSDTVIDMSQQIAARIAETAEPLDAQIEAAYLRCLQRYPQSDERELAAEFIGGDPQRLAQFIQILMASTEYRFLD
ncbi:DUF1553 domain-containing protein [Rosistilla oblonga]|uniref:DUF1553 domain-containing protein n=1 Tax=Rosistilla oblonga TaxID=2527990 RepID=UPI003A9876D8